MADQGRRHRQHLPHAWPALGSLVTHHHHITPADPAALDGGERGFFRIEDARRSRVARRFMAGNLDHAALRSQIPAQHHQTPGRAQRMFRRTHHLLAWRLNRPLGLRPDGAPGHGHGRRAQTAGLKQAAGLSLQHGKEIDGMHICFVLGLLHGGERTFRTFIGKLVDAGSRGRICAKVHESPGHVWGQTSSNRFKETGESDCPVFR